MKKMKINPKIALILVLVCVGVCVAMFVTNQRVQISGACVCWAGAIFVLAWMTRDRGIEQLNQFDIASREMLIDVANNGIESEFYGINIDSVEKQRNKIYKKNKKQVSSCLVLGFIILLIAFIPLV